jgi:CheY-like chemotaxis protein
MSRPVSLVLTEPFLPDLDGPELVRRLRGHPRTSGVYLVALVPSEQAADERAPLLGAGFDDVLPMPPTREQVRALDEHTRQPRTSVAHVRDGVVVLAVISLDSTAAIRRLRDAMLDFQRANLNRVIIDLGYAEGAAAALNALGPFLAYLGDQGIKVRVAAPPSVVARCTDSLATLPPVFASVEDALQDWA